MNDLLPAPEMETLWRLAGHPRSPVPAPPPSPKFEQLRSRIQTAMLEMVLQQLEQIAPVTAGRADLWVLLTSQHPRVRTLGIRLSAAGVPVSEYRPGEVFSG